LEDSRREGGIMGKKYDAVKIDFFEDRKNKLKEASPKFEKIINQMKNRWKYKCNAIIQI